MYAGRDVLLAEAKKRKAEPVVKETVKAIRRERLERLGAAPVRWQGAWRGSVGDSEQWTGTSSLK